MIGKTAIAGWRQTYLRANNILRKALPGAFGSANHAAELFEAPFEDATHPWGPANSRRGNNLYICADGALWQHSSQGQWNRWPVPVAGTASLPVGKRIVLSAEQSILALEPTNMEFRLLASSRRTPAVTA